MTRTCNKEMLRSSRICTGACDFKIEAGLYEQWTIVLRSRITTLAPVFKWPPLPLWEGQNQVWLCKTSTFGSIYAGSESPWIPDYKVHTGSNQLLQEYQIHGGVPCSAQPNAG